MPNQLEQIRALSPIVTDSIDIYTIKKFSSTDVNIDSAKVLTAIREPQNQHLIQNAIELARDERWGSNYKQAIVNKLFASIGVEILKNISGRIAVDIDANLSFDSDGIIGKARELADSYRKLRIDTSRILIKIPATWEGIQAVRQLQREHVNCSLESVYGYIQAQACTVVEAFQISIPVAAATNWHKTNEPELDSSGDNDPGVANLRSIYNYCKYFNYRTRVTGKGFNNITQIQALHGCDHLTITPTLMEELRKNTDALELKLLKSTESGEEYRPEDIPEKEFRWNFNASVMAHAKLAEDIRALADIQFQLEQTIGQFLEENP